MIFSALFAGIVQVICSAIRKLGYEQEFREFAIALGTLASFLGLYILLVTITFIVSGQRMPLPFFN